MRRAAIGFLLLAAFGCGGGGEADPSEALIVRLAGDPGIAPPDLSARVPILLLVVDVQGNTVALPDPPIAQPGATLRLERALAIRRTRPPALWTVVTSPDGSRIRYWCAAVRQTKVRATIVDHETDTQRGAHARTAHGLSSVRVPYEPSGQVRFYRATGGLIASYRFGSASSDPLTRIGP